ncbi:MAG: hypothetical protein OEY67_08690 [Gammaproteobacteria bacterium]|nr:hypothetical protein [Gammaproteobacteria bacterium]
MSVLKKAGFYSFLFFLSVACQKESDEVKISKALSGMEQGIENRDAGQVLELLSPLFQDHAGRDIKAVRGLMFVHFSRNERINVVTTNKAIQVHNDSARMQFDVLLLGSSNILPERGRRYKVDTEWIKENGNWLLHRMDWQSE